MPMLMTLRMRLPVCPCHCAAADLVGEGGHPVEHRVHLGHDVDAVDEDLLALWRAQGDVQNGALLRDVDLLARGTSRRCARAGRTPRRAQRADAIVSSVMRFFE